jgi:hypothetical protein
MKKTALKKTSRVSKPLATRQKADEAKDTARRTKRLGDPKLPQYTDTPFTDAQEAFEQWKQGTPVKQIAKERNFTKGVRKTFMFLAGGKDGFKALRDAGAGGRGFGGGGHVGSRPRPTIDDSTVKVLFTSPRWKVERVWAPILVTITDERRQERKIAWREAKATIYVSPKGNKFIEAKHNEKADLIVKTRVHSMQHASAVQALRWAECDAERTGVALTTKRRARLQRAIDTADMNVSELVTRLRKYETSSVARKLQKEKALATQGAKARTAKKQARVKTKATIAKKAKEVAADKKRASKPVAKKTAKKAAKRKVTR